MSVLNLNTETLDERSLAPLDKPFFLNFTKEMLSSQTIPREFKSKNVEIPKEEEIRSSNRLTLPLLISSQENDKAQIHYLCGFPHSLEFLEVHNN